MSSSRFWIAPRVERALETLVIAASIAEIAPAPAALPMPEKLIDVRLKRDLVARAGVRADLQRERAREHLQAVELGVAGDAR